MPHGCALPALCWKNCAATKRELITLLRPGLTDQRSAAIQPTERTGILLLSFAQHWFLDRLGGTSAFNISFQMHPGWDARCRRFVGCPELYNGMSRPRCKRRLRGAARDGTTPNLTLALPVVDLQNCRQQDGRRNFQMLVCRQGEIKLTLVWR